VFGNVSGANSRCVADGEWQGNRLLVRGKMVVKKLLETKIVKVQSNDAFYFICSMTFEYRSRPLLDNVVRIVIGERLD
jgi:hypothetical protein